MHIAMAISSQIIIILTAVWVEESWTYARLIFLKPKPKPERYRYNYCLKAYM